MTKIGDELWISMWNSTVSFLSNYNTPSQVVKMHESMKTLLDFDDRNMLKPFYI